MSFFGFYDTLNCAAMAVNEDGSGRPAQAQAAWEAACTFARDLFPSGTDTPAAIAAILAARALPPELRDAMTVVAFEIGMLAMAGVTA